MKNSPRAIWAKRHNVTKFDPYLRHVILYTLAKIV